MPTVIRESNKYGPATESDVRKFESLIEARLPEDYRAFLLEHNGGETDPNIFFISEEQGSDILDRLLALIKEPEHSSLYWSYDCYLGRMPSNIIPIGDDPGGNNVCISVSGADYGSIYFWDHDGEPEEDEQPYYENLYLMAASFSEFLNNLYESSDD